MTFGELSELIMVAYDARGKRLARGFVSLAVNAPPG
jgi:hypothetical protein